MQTSTTLRCGGSATSRHKTNLRCGCPGRSRVKTNRPGSEGRTLLPACPRSPQGDAKSRSKAKEARPPFVTRPKMTPTTRTRREFLSLIASIAAASQSRASELASTSLESALSAEVEEYMAERRIPGGQLAVGREGKILISKGFGLADREKQIPVSPDTLFRIAKDHEAADSRRGPDADRGG